jgi:hypothetical protein
MTTAEERLKILTMVQDGIITPEEAAQLLEAINAGEAAARASGPARPAGGPNPPYAPHAPHAPHPPNPPEGAPDVPGRRPRWLRVRVTDTNTGKPRVNVRLPVSMVNMGLKMGSKFAPQVEGLDADQLMKVIESGEVGQIVDVYDEEDGEHVEVFLE